MNHLFWKLVFGLLGGIKKIRCKLIRICNPDLSIKGFIIRNSEKKENDK